MLHIHANLCVFLRMQLTTTTFGRFTVITKRLIWHWRLDGWIYVWEMHLENEKKKNKQKNVELIVGTSCDHVNCVTNVNHIKISAYATTIHDNYWFFYSVSLNRVILALKWDSFLFLQMYVIYFCVSVNSFPFLYRKLVLTLTVQCDIK